MIIHDMQTPVQDIINWSNYLLKEIDGPLTADQREFVEVVRSNATRLQVLVEHMQGGSGDYQTLAQAIARMNHQINTPLTAIFGFSGLLLSSSDEPFNAAQSEKIRQIYATGQYLRSLVKISVAELDRDNAEQV